MGVAGLPREGLFGDPPCVGTRNGGASPDALHPPPSSRASPGRSGLSTWGHGSPCLALVSDCSGGVTPPASPACRSAWAPQWQAWAQEAFTVSQGPGGAAGTCGCFPRLAELAGKLEREEQFREAACSALQRSQEDASHRVDREVAQMQVPGGRLGPGRPGKPSFPAMWCSPGCGGCSRGPAPSSPWPPAAGGSVCREPAFQFPLSHEPRVRDPTAVCGP